MNEFIIKPFKEGNLDRYFKGLVNIIINDPEWGNKALEWIDPVTYNMPEINFILNTIKENGEVPTWERLEKLIRRNSVDETECEDMLMFIDDSRGLIMDQDEIEYNKRLSTIWDFFSSWVKLHNMMWGQALSGIKSFDAAVKTIDKAEKIMCDLKTACNKFYELNNKENNW